MALDVSVALHAEPADDEEWTMPEDLGPKAIGVRLLNIERKLDKRENTWPGMSRPSVTKKRKLPHNRPSLCSYKQTPTQHVSRFEVSVRTALNSHNAWRSSMRYSTMRTRLPRSRCKRRHRQPWVASRERFSACRI